MATSTKRRSTPRAEKPEVETPPRTEAVDEAAGPEAEKTPAPTPDPEPEWATASLLPTRQYEDTVLPALRLNGKPVKVRVRFMTNSEAAMMALLPDLARFTELMVSLQVKAAENDGKVSVRDSADLEGERLKYMRAVAHTHVVDTDAVFEEAPCEECSSLYEREITHVPSLWTREQTGFLDFPDLSHITRIAERAEVLEAIAPLSEGQTESDSSSPANTGDETPPTS